MLVHAARITAIANLQLYNIIFSQAGNHSRDTRMIFVRMINCIFGEMSEWIIQELESIPDVV
jgi:hypothetical protein